MKNFIFAILLAIVGCFSSYGQKILNQTKEQRSMVELVESNNLQKVESNLKAGANVNMTDNSGRNLLLIATKNNHLEMAKLLVNYKADVNQQADNLDSPFLLAGAMGHNDLLRLFLSHGARFDVFNRYQGTALIPACERGHVETVKLLANTKGFPIDHVNRLGWTALMEAVVLGDGSEKYQQIIRILKEAGSKMDIPDKDGITPIQHARKRGFDEIVKIISN